MVSLTSKVETGHRDIVHDAQMNFHGTRLATCSSDHLVKIFEIKSNGQSFPMAELTGHDGPVWQVNWAHPKFGTILASCSHDRKAIVWKEVNGKWQKSYEYNQHEASVNSISWAPPQYDLIFACCSTDCSVSIISWMGDVWKPIKIPKAHEEGCNAVSWAPAKRTKSLVDPTEQIDPKRIVSGGNDRLVKIWKEETPDNWVLEADLEGHEDWVRDVAWAPAESLSLSTIASCGMDGRVIIWRCTNLNEKKWTSRVLRKFDEVLWHVSWSLCATVLAVSGADNKVNLFQERLPNQWMRISEPDEDK
uniref:Protein SEC13 homolog n=1 Tax=Ditylenchus dipsaci TaxID=166011 RepID=A0A915EPD4_9BILA